MAGRGWGKTRTGSQWLAHKAQTVVGDYAVIARSTQDCRETCLEGTSGLLRALDLSFDSRAYNKANGQIRLPNGSIIYAYSAERPERVRGPNLSGAWCDEIAHWRYPQTWSETLMPALRIGNPQVVVTTTPRPIPLLRELMSRDDGSVVVIRGSTFDNAANLSPQALAELKRRYAGTRIGRQELEGELIDDVEGALWNRDLIEPYRVKAQPQLIRIVVAVDPAVTAGEDSDETGIVVAGIGPDGQGYVLDDLTCRLPPDGWARRVVHGLEKWGADRVVAEANNGGQLVETVLRPASLFRCRVVCNRSPVALGPRLNSVSTREVAQPECAVGRCARDRCEPDAAAPGTMSGPRHAPNPLQFRTLRHVLASASTALKEAELLSVFCSGAPHPLRT